MNNVLTFIEQKILPHKSLLKVIAKFNGQLPPNLVKEIGSIMKHEDGISTEIKGANFNSKFGGKQLIIQFQCLHPDESLPDLLIGEL